MPRRIECLFISLRVSSYNYHSRTPSCFIKPHLSETVHTQVKSIQRNSLAGENLELITKTILDIKSSENNLATLSSFNKKKNIPTGTMASTILTLAALAALAQGSPVISKRDNATAPYTLIASYSGDTFFDHFTTYTGPDPTNGHVNYTDMSFAAEQGLIGFIAHPDTNTTSAYIGVDHKNPAPSGRNSVRLTSKAKFSPNSLTTISLNHIPVQHGLWPAIWLLGADGAWPASGESDILEYVHKTPHNAMTLHTAPGCSVTNSSTAFTGHLEDPNCNSGSAANGCSINAPNRTLSTATAGLPFNAQGGGVYVHLWLPTGITVWLFPHDGVPADLRAGTPEPSTWMQTPLAKFSGDCDFATALRDMQLIINIDFCGDWAGKVWSESGAKGVGTCEEFVGTRPEAFTESYFDVQGIQVFSNVGGR